MEHIPPTKAALLQHIRCAAYQSRAILSVPVLPSPALWELFTSYWGMYFHYHRPPSDAVFLSSHHMPIPLQPSFLDFLCDFPHFRCPSYSLISDLTSFVTPHIHRSIPISATSNLFFQCLLQRPCLCPVYQCWSYHCSVHLPLDLHVHSPIAQHSRHSLPVLPPALHSVCDFRIQFSILRQRRYQVNKHHAPFLLHFPVFICHLPRCK